jgi:hypothetical protein
MATAATIAMIAVDERSRPSELDPLVEPVLDPPPDGAPPEPCAPPFRRFATQPVLS